jgi:outer membrane lipoprotein LolB
MAVLTLRRRARHSVLALLALGLAGGCTSFAPLAPIEQVTTGRFAARIVQGENTGSLSGRFTLATHRDGNTLDLASPLGTTIARVQTNEAGITLTTPQADGTTQTWQGSNAEALAESALGWSLPVSGLPDWLAGRPVKGRPARVTPADGPAQRIEQDGWIIVIDERFDDSGAPRLLTLERSARDPVQPGVRLRLVVEREASNDAPAESGR